MSSKILTLVVGVTLAVILFAGALMPVIGDSLHSQDRTYTNSIQYSTGNVYEFNEESDDTTIITVCKTGEHTIEINGVSHTVPTYQPVIISDGVTIRFYANSMQLSTPEKSSNVISATISISQGIAAFSDVLNTSSNEVAFESVPISWAYIYEGSGAYGADVTENGIEVYAAKNGIYASNWINTTSEYFSIKDGVVTITKSGTSTTTDVNWGGEYLDDGVYKMTLSPTSDDYTFVTDNAGVDYTVHPFMVAVPLKVTGTPDDFGDEKLLLEIIPLLVIVGIIVGVAVTLGKRLEVI